MMIEEKRQEKARLKKLEEEENEFVRLVRENSNKLNAEAAKKKKLAIEKYRSDLDNQVKYAELIKVKNIFLVIRYNVLHIFYLVGT